MTILKTILDETCWDFFICTFPHTEQHILHVLMDDLRTTAWKWKIVQTANAPDVEGRSDDPNLYRRVFYCLTFVQLLHDCALQIISIVTV